MTHNRSPANTDYPGRDLEAMSFAENYHQWILEEFYPFIGKSVAEVGAGCGNFTRILLKTTLEKLVACEPSEQMFPLLATSVEGEMRAGVVNDSLVRIQQVISTRFFTSTYWNTSKTTKPNWASFTANSVRRSRTDVRSSAARAVQRI